MFGTVLQFCALFLLSQSALAEDYSWQLSVEKARLELVKEEQNLLSESLGLSLDPENHILSQEVASIRAQVDVKRKNFQTIVAQKTFTPQSWEAYMQKRLSTNSAQNSADPFLKNALEYLQKQHPLAKSYSPMEWENLRAIYGEQAYGQFIEQSFSVHTTENSLSTLTQGKKFELVVITLPSIKDPLPTNLPHEKEISITEFPVSAYSSLDEQAAELSKYFETRHDGVPLLLFSQGEASAVVNRYIDLNPGIRKHPSILGWINFKGQNFGPKIPARATALIEKKLARKLASEKTSSAMLNRAEEQEVQWYEQLAKDGMERQNRVLSFGSGFPIFSFMDRNYGADLHESFLQDAQNIWINKGARLEALLQTLFTK